jgi:hypothetical protein
MALKKFMISIGNWTTDWREFSFLNAGHTADLATWLKSENFISRAVTHLLVYILIYEM